MNKIALLFSGGMDSYIAYHYLNSLKTGGKRDFDVVPIYVDYKGKYCDKEIRVVKEVLPNTLILKNIINLSHLEQGKKHYIPNRNLYLATIASNYADLIMMGGLKDDNVGDKSPVFCQELSNTLTCSLRRKIVVNSPFWHMEKAQVVQWYISFFGKKKAEEDLLKTTSCYSPEDIYCGHCPSCFRKFCALVANKIDIPFWNKSLAMDYHKNRFEYSIIRNTTIDKACRYLNLIR